MLEKLPNFFSSIRVKVPKGPLKQKFHLIMPEPEFDLQEKTDGLGPTHQLTIPGPGRLPGQKIPGLLPIHQMPDGIPPIVQQIL